MAVMAKWSGKTWEVSPGRIAAIDSISASVKLNTENNDDKEGSPPTNAKGLEPQSISFGFDLASAVGCDVRAEYEEWCSLIGTIAPFYLGGRRFGPENMQLISVSLSDTLLSADGQILAGNVAITLQEYAEEASGKKSGSGSGSSASGSASSGTATNGVGPRLSALNVGPSVDAKAGRKPSNPQLGMVAMEY